MKKNSHFSFFLFACVILLAGLPANAQQRVWKIRLPIGFIDATPAVGDVDGDGIPDIAAAQNNGTLFLYDMNGHTVWKTDLGDRLCTAPVLANVTGSPLPEIIVLSESGHLYCVDGQTGVIVWQHLLKDRIDWGATEPMAVDVNGDHVPEIIVADRSQTVSCFNGKGEQLWATTTHIGSPKCPAACDLGGDGRPEILYGGTETALTCLAADGKILWELEKGTNGSSPIAGDLDGDGHPEIIVGVGRNLAAVDAQGKILWSTPLDSELDAGLTAADSDGDGKAEIYAADLSGTLHCVSSTGKLLWTGNVEERVRRSPTIADVDGDGVPEILVAGYSGAIHIFTPTGQLKQRLPLPGGTANASALVFREPSSEKPVVLCPDSGGCMTLWQWPKARKDSQLLATDYRGNTRRTGQEPARVDTNTIRLAQIDYGPCFMGENTFRAEIQNPQRHACTVRLTVATKGKCRHRQAVTSRKARFTVELPYTLSVESPSTVTFSCQVLDQKTPVIWRAFQVYVIPFQNELRQLTAILQHTKPLLAATQNPGYLRDRLQCMRMELPALRRRAATVTTAPYPERRAFRDRIRGLLKEARTLEALLRTAQKATPGSGLLICAANPWAPFGNTDEILENRVTGSTARVQAFQGEHECAAFNVFNLSGTPRYVRVEPAFDKEEQAAESIRSLITLHEAIPVPTQTTVDAADALPLLNQGNVLLIPAWSGRQLWIDIDTKSLEPGTYTFLIRLRTLERESRESDGKIVLTVWPVSLPEKQALSLCHWGYVHTSVLKDQPEAALKDQLALKTNVFVNVQPPKATFDADGNLTSPLDFTEHDAYLKLYAPHGLILFFNYQSGLKGPAPLESDAYAKAYKAFLQAWVAHLKQMGIGYERYALYPVDEPGLHEGQVEHFLRWAKLAKEADPNIQIYVDPVRPTPMEGLREMARYVDIWCPNRTAYLMGDDPVQVEKLNFILSTGKKVWTYECADNAKHQSPLGYYRGQAWLVWHYGMTGIGFWSYCTARSDPWYTPTTGHEYLLIYQGNGVVDSKRWFAIRDGIEDYTMLAALRSALKQAEAAGRNDEAVQEARKILGQEADRIAGFCDKKTTPDTTGEPGMRKKADRQWKALEKVREEMAKTLEALQNH